MAVGDGALSAYLEPRVSAHDWALLLAEDPSQDRFDDEDQVRQALLGAPEAAREAARELRIRFGFLAVTPRVSAWRPDFFSDSPVPLATEPLITPEALQARMALFITTNRLQADWYDGPPYLTPPEVDPQRTLSTIFRREVIQHRVFSDAQLRDPATKVLVAFAPDDDFLAETSVELADGRVATWTDSMGDVMGSMTAVANTDERWHLHSVTPPYPLSFLRASVPESRGIEYLVPKTIAEFEEQLKKQRPDVVCLSGLSVNTRTLLEMQRLARLYGAKEVWLGNYAALAPYKILDTYDRLFSGHGPHYFYHRFVGDDYQQHHPKAEHMIANVKWVVGLDAADEPIQANFPTLHIALRLGCDMGCPYCPETSWSSGQLKPFNVDEIKAAIDDAERRGIRSVYILDPDFARVWDEALEGEVVRYLGAKGMRWAFIGSIAAVKQHWRTMVDNGLSSYYLGVENLTPHDGDKLRDIGRPWQSMFDTVRMIHRLDAWGVTAYTTYMLAHPGETVAEERVGVARLAEAVAHSQLSLRLPLEGSNDFATALSRGWIHNFEPRAWRYASLVSAPDGRRMDPMEWRRFYYEAHRTVNAFDRPGGNRDRLRIKAARKEAGKIWVKGLDEENGLIVSIMQEDQQNKFAAGIVDYLLEVVKKGKSSSAALAEIDILLRRDWAPQDILNDLLGSPQNDLGIAADDASQRSQYLVVRALELQAEGRFFQSLVLPGRPDAAGEPMPIHVEVHKKMDVPPKGVVFVLTGYGETVAMSDPVIKPFVDAGYMVVVADQRGHGFSGKPLGVDGYMDSALNMFLDCQRVLEFIEDDPRFEGLERFGFGFSQGALLQTLLDQYNPGFFSGLTLVSPTHNLGHRFDGVTAAKLAAAGKTLGDFATLDFSTLSRENRDGNLVPQDFTRFGSSPERHNAQKWLDRGMVPRHFLVRDSSVVWDRLINLSLTLAAGNRQGHAPALIYVGTRDGNIGSIDALDNSRKMLQQVEAEEIDNKDHQLLLEGDGLPEQILGEAVSFFDGRLPEKESVVVGREKPVAVPAPDVSRRGDIHDAPPAEGSINRTPTSEGGAGRKVSGGVGDAKASFKMHHGPSTMDHRPVGADLRVRPDVIHGGGIIAGRAIFDGNAALKLDTAVIAEPSVVLDPQPRLRLVDREQSTDDITIKQLLTNDTSPAANDDVEVTGDELPPTGSILHTIGASRIGVHRAAAVRLMALR